MQAGDVLLFLAGQVTHGAYKWINPVPRRCVLHNYVPLGRALRWRPGQFREVVEEPPLSTAAAAATAAAVARGVAQARL